MQPLTYEPGDAHAIDVDCVTVDGSPIDLVIMACPRRGVVDAYQRDGEGNIKLDKRRKHALTKRHRGQVRVVFKDGSVDAGGGRGLPER